jgi:hypothetical protein
MSKTPSIAVIPSGYKGGVEGVDGKVYSVLPTNGDADLEFTRNCVATRVNQNGLIEEVLYNVPRLDYSDGGCPSLLLEPQRTNVISYSDPKSSSELLGQNNILSEAFISFDWGIGLDSAISFEGDDSVTKFVYFTNTTFDNTQTFSFFVRMDDGSKPIVGTNTGSGDFRIISQGSVSPSEIKYEEFNNSVWRVSVDYDYTAVGSSGIIKYTTQSDKGFKVSAFQLEEGSYATSYIPTDGGVVTRFKDQASKDNLESYINSSEGVLYAEISALAQLTDSRIISLNNGTSDYYVWLNYSNVSNKIRCVYGFLGSNSADFQTTFYDTTQKNKIAFSWKQNQFKFFVNGSKISEQLEGDAMPTSALNKLEFSRPIGTENMSGKVKDLRVYNEALTDAELITLTQ